MSPRLHIYAWIAISSLFVGSIMLYGLSRVEEGIQLLSILVLMAYPLFVYNIFFKEVVVQELPARSILFSLRYPLIIITAALALIMIFGGWKLFWPMLQAQAVFILLFYAYHAMVKKFNLG